jgi:glutaminyl-tRNA synthetase
MYDYTHCLSDAIEGITHSLCTLEFEDHRPLYDWFLETLTTPCHPQQIEFARLQLEYTVMSKRKLAQLVAENHVAGWDDPRMPTIAGLRRRGFTPNSIRTFCERIGVTKKDAWIKLAALESCIREDLNAQAPRAMVVQKPLTVVIENYPDEKTEILSQANHPQQEVMGRREVPFSKIILIEQADFSLTPPPKFKRLIEGGEVRLRGAYVIKCEKVITDKSGKVIELRCTYDEKTLGKKPEGRKVKGVIHWVSKAHSIPTELRLYEPLFTEANPEASTHFLETLNPHSLTILTESRAEASLKTATAEGHYQFERCAYFCMDKDSRVDNLVFNQTVSLREAWSK